MNDISVLITGIGAPGVYGVIKCLRQNGERNIRIIGVDIDPDIASRYFVDQFYFVPRRTSPEFMPSILDIVKKERVDVVFPVPTSELELFASSKERFEASGQKVVISDLPGLATSNNKAKLYRYLNDVGIGCVAKHAVVHDLDTFVVAAQDLGYPGKPVCMKKPVSMGAQGFRLLDESANHVEELLDRFPDSTLTTLKAITSVLGEADQFPTLIVQEYLPGPEYDVDVLARHGETLISIPRRNERMLWGMSLVSYAERHEEIMSLTAQIVRELKLDYVISPTFRIGSDGRPRIIEINPRVPGSIMAALGAGANLPYLAIKVALGEDFELPEIRWETKMVRYWEELIISTPSEHDRTIDKQQN